MACTFQVLSCSCLLCSGALGPACFPCRRPAKLHAVGFALLIPVRGLTWFQMLREVQGHCRGSDIVTMQVLCCSWTCAPAGRPASPHPA